MFVPLVKDFEGDENQRRRRRKRRAEDDDVELLRSRKKAYYEQMKGLMSEVNYHFVDIIRLFWEGNKGVSYSIGSSHSISVHPYLILGRGTTTPVSTYSLRTHKYEGI